MKPLWVIGKEWLQAHEEYQNYGSKNLEKLVTDPKLTRFVWRKARKALNLPDAPRKTATAHNYPAYRKPRVLAIHDTRIEINVLTGMATVMAGGETTVTKIRHMEKIVEFYKHHGYLYMWINTMTILLFKSKAKARRAA